MIRGRDRDSRIRQDIVLQINGVCQNACSIFCFCIFFKKIAKKGSDFFIYSGKKQEYNSKNFVWMEGLPRQTSPSFYEQEGLL